ncbi:MAG: Rieske (2Fe-2S) protein [Acidobacteria bacterium]|nr:Rieske (2Fe-2S) protein [Acidobacteriota bacterium]MCY3970271.1 Rieske (2Fe-2S) protein [Acidobacteriota bacterium]
MNRRSQDAPADTRRRRFIVAVSRATMAAGLLGGYGVFGSVLGRFLYPAGDSGTVWQFVTPTDRLAVGDSLIYTTPAGAEVHVTRRDDTGATGDFTALSNVCPHLGCQVHWQPQHNRYFCPCHNGVFDREGRGVSGPPEGMVLSGYPIEVRGGMVFIKVEATPLVVPERRS